MPILNNKLLENVPVPLPNDDLFMRFEKKVSPLFDKILILQKENVQLSKMLEEQEQQKRKDNPNYKPKLKNVFFTPDGYSVHVDYIDRM